MKKMGRGNSFRTTPRSKSGKLMRPAVFMHQMVTTARDSGVGMSHMTTTTVRVCTNVPKAARGVDTPVCGQLGGEVKSLNPTRQERQMLWAVTSMFHIITSAK